MREAWQNASGSDKLVAVGGPIIGVLALVAGVATSDTTTAIIGAVALISGLLFAVPLVKAGGRRDPR